MPDAPATQPVDDKTARKRPRSLLGRVRRWLLLALLVYIVWLVLLYFGQGFVIFPGRLYSAAHGEALPAGFQSLWLERAGGVEIEAWLLPASGITTGASAGPVKRHAGPFPVLMLLHGNGELIDHNVYFARRYARRGFAVLMMEYRGYGRTGGHPSQEALVRDAVAWYDELADIPEVDAHCVVVHGKSLGTGIAAQLAKRRDVDGLILQSAFTSVRAFSWRLLAPPALVRYPFDTAAALPQLNVPILLLHGRADTTIPIRHARRLRDLAPNAELRAFAGGHSGLGETHEREAFWAAIDAFLSDVCEAAGPADRENAPAD